MLLTIAGALVIGFAVYVMTPAERQRFLAAALTPIQRQMERRSGRRSGRDAFHHALRARTPLVFVTPVLVVVHTVMFVAVLFGHGSMGDPETLVAWGANFGPRTTNGEWSRLVTAMFLHPGLLQLLVNTAALLPAGLLLERLVGGPALAAVYLTAGVAAGVQIVSWQPMFVSAGASHAIFGLYGLLLAALTWRVVGAPRDAPARSRADAPDAEAAARPATDAAGPNGLASAETMEGQPPTATSVQIPLRVVLQVVPWAALFFLYYGVDGFSGAELTALLAGTVCGLVLTRRAARQTPAFRHVAALTAAAAVLVAASALLVRKVADVRPEIARVRALEEQTASEYEKAVARFKKGLLSADALAKVIDDTILPELQAARVRLQSFQGVPQEHQPLMAGAEEYLRLRHESWRVRAQGLHKRNMVALKNAETPEREALHRLQSLIAHP